MNLVVNGNRYSGFLSARVNTQMDALSRNFSFRASTQGIEDVPFRPGQRCDIEIGGERIFRGYIEKISMKTNRDGNEYRIEGRDLLADLIDSNIPELDDIGLTVKTIARRVVNYLGIPVAVIDRANTGARPFEDEYDIVAPEPSDTAFGFLQQSAMRRQVLMHSDGDSNLILTRGIGTSLNTRLVNRRDGVGNNLVGAEYTVDHSQRFGRYETESQINVAAVGSTGGFSTPDEIANTRAFVRDSTSGMRTSRRKNVSSESSYPEGDGLDRARWEMNVSRSRSRLYKATLPSHRDEDGALWRINTAPVVIDEFSGINSRMLISGVTYILDESGSTTELTLTNRDAFSLALNDPEGFDIE